MQSTSFELQFTFSTLKSNLIVNNATIIFLKIPNETFNLNLNARHIFESEKPKFQFEWRLGTSLRMGGLEPEISSSLMWSSSWLLDGYRTTNSFSLDWLDFLRHQKLISTQHHTIILNFCFVDLMLTMHQRTLSTLLTVLTSLCGLIRSSIEVKLQICRLEKSAEWSKASAVNNDDNEDEMIFLRAVTILVAEEPSNSTLRQGTVKWRSFWVLYIRQH